METYGITANRAVGEAAELFAAQKARALHQKHTNSQERKEKLKKLLDYVLSRQDQLVAALKADFSKPAEETMLTESLQVVLDIKYVLKHLDSWMKPKKVRTPLMLIGTSSRIMYEAKGVCLIIAPWNYPFNLAIGPLIYAIAAGNCAIVKPSELTPHTSAFIADMAESLFPPEEVTVMEGGVETAKALLGLPFDHIYFTGSPRVGKLVMEAASKHLSSVTLELGGKSPAIVDNTARIEEAANRIAWGKFVNAGQTCIAPDYVLIDKQAEETFVKAFAKQVGRFYGKDPKQSASFARIVNNSNHTRLSALLGDAVENGAVAAVGGQSEPAENYLAPTLLTGVTPQMRIMQEEIFGPILPVLTYSQPSQALEIIRALEKPLSLYVFSQDKRNVRYFLDNTTAGGSCINDCLLHFTHHGLPFGGVNNSGIGKSHGHYSFLAFSNERPVLRQRNGFTGTKPLFPPYSSKTRGMIGKMTRWL